MLNIYYGDMEEAVYNTAADCRQSPRRKSRIFLISGLIKM